MQKRRSISWLLRSGVLLAYSALGFASCSVKITEKGKIEGGYCGVGTPERLAGQCGGAGDAQVVLGILKFTAKKYSLRDKVVKVFGRLRQESDGFYDENDEKIPNVFLFYPNLMAIREIPKEGSNPLYHLYHDDADSTYTEDVKPRLVPYTACSGPNGAVFLNATYPPAGVQQSPVLTLQQKVPGSQLPPVVLAEVHSGNMSQVWRNPEDPSQYRVTLTRSSGVTMTAVLEEEFSNGSWKRTFTIQKNCYFNEINYPD